MPKTRVIGELWTWATFDALKEAEMAKANYEKLQKELGEYRVFNVQAFRAERGLPVIPGSDHFNFFMKLWHRGAFSS